MAKKFYAQKDALGFPIAGVMMSADKVPAQSNIIEITKEMTLPAHPSGLKYYVRLDEKGEILANSLFVHYGPNTETGIVSLQQTLAPTFNAKIGPGGMMGTPSCAMTDLNINVTLVGGNTLGTATSITGDFEGLGFGFVPPINNNGMPNPGSDVVVVMYNETLGYWESRLFVMSAAGTATGINGMMQATSVVPCYSYYYIGDEFASGDCGNPSTITNIGVASPLPLTIGKYYETLPDWSGSRAMYITATGSVSNMNIGVLPVAYDTCNAVFV
jgi:hypothetical protein